MTTLLVKIYGHGLALLAVAIVLNLVAKTLGIATWYDFILAMQSSGFVSAAKHIGVVSLLFLFVLYPLALGGVMYYFRG